MVRCDSFRERKAAYLSLEIATQLPLLLTGTGCDKIQIDLTRNGIRLSQERISCVSENLLFDLRLTALSLMASLINLKASLTSCRSTVSDHRILAWASESRIMLSNCRVVAVIRRSCVLTSSPTFRIST